ncbi:TetR family transcriptional regulator [Actinoplanes sp. NPDC049596]|uniref:TetR family transcriptional regulator n=1 Tax=unclassified Actinoplanes TaxID=2626549 RepID=UPI00344086C0
MVDERGLTMAQRKRQVVSDELKVAALQLMAARGFDTVTVDEIVAAAGVSRRTFFRYYASKEDVVVEMLETLGDQMRAELASRPAGEPTAVALRHAVEVAVLDCAGNTGKALPVVQLVLRTPALYARSLERQTAWRYAMTAVLAARLGRDTATDMYPGLAVGVALTALEDVLRRWAESDGKSDPLELTARAFDVITPALSE